MPRLKPTFKTRAKVFTGRRNPGGKVGNNRPDVVSENLLPGIGSEPRPSSDANPQNPQNVVLQKESSSKRKIGSHINNYNQYKGSCSFEGSCNDIVNLGKIEMLLSKIAVCNQCGGSISICTSNRQGHSVNIHMKCNSCAYEVSEYNSNKLQECSGKTEINVRLAYAFRSIGKAEYAANVVCGIMNLPRPPAFKYYTKVVGNAVKEVCEASMREAAEETVGLEENDSDRDITAIFDGTWQKRGHNSLNGVVSAISGETGKVLDVKILTKYCRCRGRLEQKHETGCTANYQGTSGGMESQGILEMFRESEAKYGIRYKYFLGDGDSSAYPNVVKEQPYGPEFEIIKRECVGHVQKRMGSRLRTLKKKWGKTKLADGKSIGGKGRLTNSVINDMQLYYGLAIRRNINSLEGMRTAIWAQYFHMISTNEHPAHSLCPRTADSWCKYQKAKINGEEYDHRQHNHVKPIVMELIKPIFRNLTDRTLLAKCLHGKTQNPSESLNNVIWSRVPKTTFVMKETLKLGAYEAIACFNKGNIVKCEVLHKLGITPGVKCVEAMRDLDESRIKRAEKAISEVEKKCRQKLTAAKRRLEDTYEAQEDPDNPSYGPGMH